MALFRPVAFTVVLLGTVFMPESSAPNEARGSSPSKEIVKEEESSAGVRAAEGKGLGEYGQGVRGAEDLLSFATQAEERSARDAAVNAVPNKPRRETTDASASSGFAWSAVTEWIPLLETGGTQAIAVPLRMRKIKTRSIVM